MYEEIKKKIKKWDKTINSKLIDILEKEAIPMAKELIIDDYGFNLNDIANPKSKLAPERFEDEFIGRLERFKFIEETEKGIKIICPDINNFDFRGELKTIKTILEGIAGTYVEIEREDYIKASKKQTYQGRADEVFLVRYTGEVRKWEKILDKKFERYPFSNTAPIDIFGRACQYIGDNLDRWIDNAIDKSKGRVVL